ncbi:MAG: tetratricopeptide repeat protein [Kiritimatiellae bacterium]|nr:tetratricopeptide repeat protein [Kiritimatiellia bacterium]
MKLNDDLELPVSVKAAPSDHLGVVDYAVAFGVAVVIFSLMKIWAFPGVYPNAWEDVAVAAGLRPAANVAPGIWLGLATLLFRSVSVANGVVILNLLGPFVIAFSAGLVYLLFREILSLTSRLRLQFSPQRFLIVRLASFLGALFFGCADPIWRAGQTFAPVTLLLFLSVLGVYLFFSFLQGGKLASAYLAMFVLGIVSAETPMGFCLVALCWGVFFLAVRHVLYLDMPLLNPFIEQISKWHMTFLFALGLLGTIALNCLCFGWFNGMAAAGLVNGDLPVCYGVRFWELVVGAASPLGWVLAVGVVVLPVALSAGLLPRAVDEEQFLPYHIGALYFATGLLTFAQLASLDALWMWTWIAKPVLFRSQYMLCLLMLAAALTVTFSLVVLGVDAFCRNHRRLAMQMFAEMQMDAENEQLLASKGFLGTLRRIGLVLLPLLLIAGVVPGRRLLVPRQSLGILVDYVREVVREAGDASWIFTDGSFDAAYELAAAVEGRALRAMSMMASNSARDVWIRSQGLVDQEDLLTMKSGAAATLRTWVKDKPDRLAASALQMGFEMWKRDGKQPPAVSGVLCRPVGMSEEARREGIVAANALVKRMLDIYAAGGLAKAAGVDINNLFLFAQWRLSRMMRARAESADLAGRTEEAMTDIKLADELDNHNEAIKQIRENMERMRQMMLRQMTPREGLQLALVRADFNLARKYAEPILDADPDEPNANFGMGMSYFVEKQWSRAEEFLRRCLVRKPQEPATYNNLAIVQLNTGRYEAALKNAKKALALIPDSAEVKDTIRQIEKAISQASAAKRQ